MVQPGPRAALPLHDALNAIAAAARTPICFGEIPKSG
jgi:hypothetical protein